MKNKKTRQRRIDSPLIVRVLPLQNAVGDEVSDVTKDQELAKTKNTASKKVIQEKDTSILVVRDTVRLAEVIAWFVNPFIYVTFSVVYFVLGPLW